MIQINKLILVMQFLLINLGHSWSQPLIVTLKYGILRKEEWMKLVKLVDILKLYVVFNLVRIAIVLYLPVLIILFDVGYKLMKKNGRALNLINSILVV